VLLLPDLLLLNCFSVLVLLIASVFATLAVRELAPPGELTSSKVFPFEFRSVEMQYDSFRGQQVMGAAGGPQHHHFS
jgi:hypothetical protein